MKYWRGTLRRVHIRVFIECVRRDGSFTGSAITRSRDRAAIMDGRQMTSGSGTAPEVNVTCELFYESVIGAVEMLNAASQDNTRSVID